MKTMKTASRTLALVLAAAAGAQQFQEGYSAGATTPLPATAGQVLSTALGLVWFDGTNLMLQTPGLPPQSRLTFPASTFGSFTIAIDATHVLFGEGSTNGVWRVPLTGAGVPQQLATLTLNYDAALLDAGRAVVSAKTGGFAAAENDLVALDLTTGQTHVFARFFGASGPVAVASNGDVYYATASNAWPPTAGTVSILRLPRAKVDHAILTGTLVADAEMTMIATGLDAAGDLEFDDDGDLFFTDWFQSKIGQVHGALTNTPQLRPALADYAAAAGSATTLQFVAATPATPFVFEPFQPTGGVLLVHETDWFSLSRLRHATTQQPVLSCSVPQPVVQGPFALTTVGGPAHGIGVLTFATTTQLGTVSLQVPGFEQPLWWDQALLGAAVHVLLAFDGSGQTSLPIVNPGFSPNLSATAQVAVISVPGTLGASNALPLVIGQ
jgi:hypothetical protein